MDGNRKYSNEEITVLWQPKKCTHSANCVKSLRPVFDPKRQPWIEMDNGTTEEIITTVNNCPSGALSFTFNAENQA
jgi:uncharacterized Fe-S cluster protein YjdI